MSRSSEKIANFFRKHFTSAKYKCHRKIRIWLYFVSEEQIKTLSNIVQVTRVQKSVQL